MNTMHKTNVYILLIAAGIVSWILPAFGQDATFTASTEQTTVAMGNQFEVSFALSGSSSGRNFRPPAFNDFLVLSGPNQSTSFQMGTGGTFASITYSYVLQPRSEGKFTIGSASIEYNGKQLQSNSLAITVVKGTAQNAPAPQRGRSSDEAAITQQIGDNLLVRVTVDKSRVYQGQQVTATYKIYNRINLVDLKVSKNPSLTGFWAEDLGVPQRIQWTTEVYNGKQYRVGLLKRVALFPQRSGSLEIDPIEIDCTVQAQTRRRSNDIFDQFFNDPFFGNVTNVNYSARSTPLKITVQPLPADNVPAGFNGAVGDYAMDAFLDKREVKTNDPVTLKVKIRGSGNMKLLNAPEVQIPPDLEKYDPKVSDTEANQGDRIAGARTFEYVLIPRHAGEQKIPSFPFTYFDPERKQYVALKSPEFVLKVEKGTDLEPTAVAGISKEDVKLLGEDIRFIKSGDGGLRQIGETYFGSAAYFMAGLTPFAVFIGFVLYMRRRERVLGDLVSLRNRKARKMAVRRLAQAKGFLQSQKKEEFYTEVSRALWGYTGDKLGIPPSDLSIDAVRESLKRRGVSDELVSKLGTTIGECEFARFAPVSNPHQLDQFYEATVSLMSDIEDQIR